MRSNISLYKASPNLYVTFVSLLTIFVIKFYLTFAHGELFVHFENRFYINFIESHTCNPVGRSGSPLTFPPQILCRTIHHICIAEMQFGVQCFRKRSSNFGSKHQCCFISKSDAGARELDGRD